MRLSPSCVAAALDGWLSFAGAGAGTELVASSLQRILYGLIESLLALYPVCGSGFKCLLYLL
jgi:hypothetical protein